ncbi:MAG: conjugal transfer protein TraF [Pseudomonadota bacterium]
MDWFSKTVLPLVLVTSVASVQAAEFGVYDARGLGMAGVTVTAGNNSNALFYNPALLAFYDEFEEDTQDARFLFPIITPQLSDASETLLELESDDLDVALTSAVNRFNSDASPANAQQIVSLSQDAANALSNLSSGSLYGDVIVGLALSEPSKRQGGGFYLVSRFVGGGRTTIDPTDLELLADYQEALTFVATSGADGVPHPELFDASGALIDPNTALNSSVQGAGAQVTELGVTMSNQFEFLSRPIGLGLGSKVMRIDVFDEVEQIIQGDLSVADNRRSDLTVNFDFGLAMKLTERFDLGLAVKDVLPKNYETASGREVRFRARPRLGLSYRVGDLQLALDVDLIESQPLAGELPSQISAVGMEWKVFPSIAVRGGFRQDTAGERGSAWSTGAGFQWRRWLIDVAYMEGDVKAAGVQLGYAF